MSDLSEQTDQIKHDVENLEKRIDILQTQINHSIIERRKKVAVLAKLTDKTVEETEVAKEWVPKST